ncbi:MAG: hypothetical protein EOO86_07495 [Pedobacter sp.]|nr:MAG: hypothetical protein EOO86_07495 [Pedobacter sp.]
MDITEELTVLKRHLPRDWVSQVMRKVSFSATAIRMVMRNKLDNQEILKAIILVAKENKAKSERLTAEIKNDLIELM